MYVYLKNIYLSGFDLNLSNSSTPPLRINLNEHLTYLPILFAGHSCKSIPQYPRVLLSVVVL
ncbi:unnamed protein product [Tenebrio molitor]|nr:unnamed protein product [Tenebrio molitor]